ncbi:unnamed protein product [Acanthoscelides obtectus]|uniref:beta-glucosidase n=1 Tax=Acanthoscelides obtectus TaxID=200917 RepID=A0A9P0JHY6_ACAOB|nr:unnamed protein product [Acanthoscelides obtectus]CAK1661321.1 hypothetical protein AOBTE_LOCUS22569 [Acanthoscelides obtectus]
MLHSERQCYLFPYVCLLLYPLILGGFTGRIAIVISYKWYEPLLPNVPAFEEAANTNMEFESGMYGHPLYKGDWPEIVKAKVSYNSKKEGRQQSRLPELSPEEIERIKGTNDFLGLNYYVSALVYPAATPQPAGFMRDLGVDTYQPWYWEQGKTSFIKVTPWGFKKLLKYLKDAYDNPEIIIIENGFNDDGQLDDVKRISYIERHLSAILEAREDFGVNVSGYSVWSFMDVFEWNFGYGNRFGLYHVDFADPKRPRTMKKSARYYRDVIKTRSLDKTSDYPTCFLE